MKMFVTGGAGFIGSDFIRYALKAGSNHSIINYDKLRYAGNLANLHAIADHPGY
jgi:dTDP-glucose 4,6-dehydratase